MPMTDRYHVVTLNGRVHVAERLNEQQSKFFCEVVTPDQTPERAIGRAQHRAKKIAAALSLTSSETGPCL